MRIDTWGSALCYRFGSKNAVTRRFSIFFSSELIWVMIGVVYGSFLFRAPVITPGTALRAASILFFGLLVSWLVTISLSYLIRRVRPFQVGGFSPLIHMPWVTPSFPSGHATYAFALLALIEPAHVWLFLPLALLVAFGRLCVGVHYPSDVCVGAVIGYGVTTLFLTVFPLLSLL